MELPHCSIDRPQEVKWNGAPRDYFACSPHYLRPNCVDLHPAFQLRSFPITIAGSYYYLEE